MRYLSHVYSAMAEGPPSFLNDRMGGKAVLATSVGIVGIVVVLLSLALVPLLTQSPGGVCSALECGTPGFVVGVLGFGPCPPGSTFVTAGCSEGDYTYHLAIEQSVVTFDQVLFRIQTPGGVTYAGAGGHPGFSILNYTETIVAQYSTQGGPMAMTGGWTYLGNTGPSTPLTNLYTIIVDVGTADLHGEGMWFVVNGTAGYSDTGIITLP
jgi:hypothetical protein